MEFAILGPLRAVGAHGPIELKAPKQRALLATLLLAHGDGVVSAERLIDALWGDEPPATASKALQVHVSQLRRVLGPGQPIVTRPTGYAVRLASGAARPRAVPDARRRRAPGCARRRRRGGRGDPARGARPVPRRRRSPTSPLPGRARRSSASASTGCGSPALEERLELDLERGAHAGGRRRAARRSRPSTRTASGCTGSCMLALYRSGRQADALDAYRRVRRALVDELGLEPGGELQRLEAAILAHDPSLELDSARTSRAARRTAARRPAPPRGRGVPVPPTPLLGRDARARGRRGAARASPACAC